MDDLLGVRPVALEHGGDRDRGVELAGGRRAPPALGEAALGVGVHDEHPPAQSRGERARKVVRATGFADAPLLVQERDDGHESPPCRCWCARTAEFPRALRRGEFPGLVIGWCAARTSSFAELSGRENLGKDSGPTERLPGVHPVSGTPACSRR